MCDIRKGAVGIDFGFEQSYGINGLGLVESGLETYVMKYLR